MLVQEVKQEKGTLFFQMGARCNLMAEAVPICQVVWGLIACLGSNPDSYLLPWR